MMNDALISLYIDDELTLEDKIAFLQAVRADSAFAEESLALLYQERQLRHLEPAPPLPPMQFDRHGFRWPLIGEWFMPPVKAAVAALALVLLFFVARPPETPPQAESHRFVVYLPEVNQARLIGTFTDWQPVAMAPVGRSGYWTLTLQVPKGEHRYSYLLDDGRQIADPTVVFREQDDFGGENSVLEVKTSI